MKQFLVILSIILLLSAPALAWEYEDDHSDEYQSSYDREDLESFRTDRKSQDNQDFLQPGIHYDNYESYEITPAGKLRDPETFETYDPDESLPSGYKWDKTKSGGVYVH